MNATETARICRAIAGLKPAQHFDEETPALWAMVLADVRYDDARQAVLNLAARVRFIDPCDLTGEIKRIRDRRLAGVDRIAHLAETPAEYRELIRRVADGELHVPAISDDDPDQVRRIEASIRGMFRLPALPMPRDSRSAPTH